jgi:hypothetical protein
MADANAFSKMVPGFDFLQGLVKNAGAALPNVGQWIAPTVNPEELEKRINELRTVQFWLEQNARMLGTTIQAMEVQRMTLSTLKTMNVSMADLRDSLTLKMPDFGAASASAASAAAEPSPKAAPKPAADEGEEAAAPAAAVDPMQWWGALTKQFTELATNSLQDGTADAARNLASAMVKQSLDTAGATLKSAVNMPAEVAKQAASVVSKAAEVGQAVVKEAAARKTTARKTASASADKTASAATKSPSAKTTARKTATPSVTKAAAKPTAKPAGRS